MSHRRLHSSSETIPLSWDNNNNPWKSKERPRISWDNRPWASKERPRISWENTPWTSKERPRISWDKREIRAPRVAPELVAPRRSLHGPGIPIPLPPCQFQPPGMRSSPKKWPRKEDDPFLAAYIECTKSVKVVAAAAGTASPKEGKRGGIGFSCKRACGVREDGMVRLSQLHVGRPRDRLLEKEMEGEMKGRRSSFF